MFIESAIFVPELVQKINEFAYPLIRNHIEQRSPKSSHCAMSLELMQAVLDSFIDAFLGQIGVYAVPSYVYPRSKPFSHFWQVDRVLIQHIIQLVRSFPKPLLIYSSRFDKLLGHFKDGESDSRISQEREVSFLFINSEIQDRRDVRAWGGLKKLIFGNHDQTARNSKVFLGVSVGHAYL